MRQGPRLKGGFCVWICQHGLARIGGSRIAPFAVLWHGFDVIYLDFPIFMKPSFFLVTSAMVWQRN